MRARTTLVAAALGALLAVLPGCIMLRSDQIPSWVPQAARPATPTPTAAKTAQPAKGGLAVYFVKGGRLVAAGRSAKVSATSPKQALEALFEGPSSTERAAGMSTAIPAGTRVNDAAQDFNGYMRVDLSSEFGSGGSGASMKLRLAQVVFVTSQFPGVKGAVIQLDGKPVERFGSEAYRLMRPLGTGDFADVRPGG